MTYKLQRGLVVEAWQAHQDLPNWDPTWHANAGVPATHEAAISMLAAADITQKKKLRKLVESFESVPCGTGYKAEDAQHAQDLPKSMYKLYRELQPKNSSLSSESPSAPTTGQHLQQHEGQERSTSATLHPTASNTEAVKRWLCRELLMPAIRVVDAASADSKAFDGDKVREWLGIIHELASQPWEAERDLQIVALGAWCSVQSVSCTCVIKRSKLAFSANPTGNGLVLGDEASMSDIGHSSAFAPSSACALMLRTVGSSTVSGLVVAVIELKLLKDCKQALPETAAGDECVPIDEITSGALIQALALAALPLQMMQATSLDWTAPTDRRLPEHFPCMMVLLFAGPPVDGRTAYAASIAFEPPDFGGEWSASCRVGEVLPGLSDLADGIEATVKVKPAEGVQKLATLVGVMDCEGSPCRMTPFAFPCLPKPRISQGVIIACEGPMQHITRMFTDVHILAGAETMNSFLLKLSGRPWPRVVEDPSSVRAALVTLIEAKTKSRTLDYMPIKGVGRVPGGTCNVIIMEKLSFKPADRALIQLDPHGFCSCVADIIVDLAAHGLVHIDLRCPNFGVLVDTPELTWKALDADSILPWTHVSQRAAWAHPFLKHVLLCKCVKASDAVSLSALQFVALCMDVHELKSGKPDDMMDFMERHPNVELYQWAKTFFTSPLRSKAQLPHGGDSIEELKRVFVQAVQGAS